MELEQVIQRLEWLEEERRKTQTGNFRTRRNELPTLALEEISPP